MNRNATVGLFVLAGLALFTAGLFMIGNRHEAFSRHLVVYADFRNLSGLAKGSKVQVAGMDAGQVEAIRIPSSPSSKFRVRIRLNESLHGLVRTDSVATIGTEGVVGDTFLSIRPGSAEADAIGPEGLLRSKEPTELADLLDQAKGTISDVDTAVNNANGVLLSVGGSVNSTLTTARNTIANVDTVVSGIKRGEGAAGLLLRDPKTAESIRQTIANVQQTTRSLQEASGQANAIVADVHSRNFPQKVDDALASVRDATARIDATSAVIQKIVSDLGASDDNGNTAGVNLRDTLTNLNAASGNFDEDTEALKHNLLLRGYFRHRGYFSLTGIAPGTYRKDPVLASTRNPRAWLDARQIFRAGSLGRPELTAEGTSAIDQAIAQFGDELESAPVMVEGYDESGSLAEKIDTSRERALVVRNYLRERYHLAAVDVGAIGLDNTPPEKSQHVEWNGICIVLIRSAHR